MCREHLLTSVVIILTMNVDFYVSEIDFTSVSPDLAQELRERQQNTFNLKRDSLSLLMCGNGLSHHSVGYNCAKLVNMRRIYDLYENMSKRIFRADAMLHQFLDELCTEDCPHWFISVPDDAYIMQWFPKRRKMFRSWGLSLIEERLNNPLTTEKVIVASDEQCVVMSRLLNRYETLLQRFTVHLDALRILTTLLLDANNIDVGPDDILVVSFYGKRTFEVRRLMGDLIIQQIT